MTTQPNNITNRVDEVLVAFARKYDTDDDRPLEQARTKLLQLIESVLLEVVGEDETTQWGGLFKDKKPSNAQYHRNQLRHQIKQSIKEKLKCTKTL